MTTWRGGWAALLISSAARILLAITAGLLLSTLVPAVFGWHPSPVLTGSMRPVLTPGDVVLARPVPAPDLRIGQILLVADPDHQGRLRLHRLARIDNDTLVLRGDANSASDSSPVKTAQIRGVATLRIPFIGKAIVWQRDGDYVKLIGLGVAIPLVLVAAWAFQADSEQERRRRYRRVDRHGPAHAQHDGHRRNNRSSGRPTIVMFAVLITVLGAATLKPQPARAVPFKATASNAASNWAAVAYYTCKAAVLAVTPYLFYELDDNNANSGSNVKDSSGNSRTGTFQGSGSTAKVAGSCPRDGGTAVSLNGSTSYVSTPTQLSAPNVFTLMTWFKTSTTSGGKLVGFGSSRTGSSSNYDRHVYLDNSGHVVFGVYPSAVKTVSSSATYNDNAWHLAVASLSTAGMKLYLDGALVASDSTVTSGESTTGYWRIGYDNLAGWGTTTPTSFFFQGTLDDVAVFSTALTATQVAALYTAS